MRLSALRLPFVPEANLFLALWLAKLGRAGVPRERDSFFTSPRRAGRGRGSEATEGEGAPPRFWANGGTTELQILAVKLTPAERLPHPDLLPAPRGRMKAPALFWSYM